MYINYDGFSVGSRCAWFVARKDRYDFRFGGQYIYLESIEEQNVNLGMTNTFIVYKSRVALRHVAVKASDQQRVIMREC